MSFADFFKVATDNTPYEYQCRLACGPDADPEQPDTLGGGTACRSQLINIPTGLGKTATVTLAWLWRQGKAKFSDWQEAKRRIRRKAARVA